MFCCENQFTARICAIFILKKELEAKLNIRFLCKMSSNTSENVSTEKNYKPASDPQRIFAKSPEDEIVISGMAGRYPSCDNVGELRENLFNKVGWLQYIICIIKLILFHVFVL